MNLRDLWKWLKAEFRWRVLGKRYEVHMTEEAQRQFDELPEEAKEEIRKAMERIARNPYSGERIELEGEEETEYRGETIELEEEEAEG